MCLVKGKPLIVLYDSSVTHSFIVYDCVTKLELPISHLSHSLFIATPTNKLETINFMCENYNLVIDGRTFVVDLVGSLRRRSTLSLEWID